SRFMRSASGAVWLMGTVSPRTVPIVTMNERKEYTDVKGRTFYYDQGARVYLDGGNDTGADLPSSEPPALLAKNLKDYLASKSWARLGERTKWLPISTLDVTTGALWVGDPHLANKDDGCVVHVPPGV